MGAAKKLIDKRVLRDLIPLNALSAAHLEEISRKAVITDIRSGRYVFKKGDRDYQSIYLLDGKLELLGDSRDTVSEIHSGSEAARHPLAHKQPRQLSARAIGNVTVACIDSSLLDVLLTWDESSGYDVVEIDAQDDDDWMTRMLQSQAFLQLPPSNIHQLLMRLETIHASAGQVIVRQGDDGDYFYIVKNGRLSVTRKASSRGSEVALAELGEGACFGEEALVSGTKRNASVTMLTDGCLMRLAQADFNELLRTSLVHEIDFTAAQKLIAEGAQWLDVRLPGELENQAIKGALNLPLSALRDQAAELNEELTYIVCCDTGRRSAAGAFVLSQHGLTVYTLKNGLMDVPDKMLTRNRASTTEPRPAGAAEIIQFESDAEDPESKDSAAGTSKAEAGEQAILEQLKRQNESLENDLLLARRERDDLETKLMKRLEAHKGSQSDQSHHAASEDKQQESARRIRELEEEIERVRSDYQQLGQRTSALGGERDAVAKDLEKARKEVHSLQEQLSSKREESSGQSGDLERKLEEAEKALEALSAQEQDARDQLHQEQAQRQALEQRYDEQQKAYQEQEIRTQEKGLKDEQIQAEKEKLAADLEERKRELDAYGERLNQSEQREQALREQLQDAARNAEETLLQFNTDAQGVQEALNQRIEELSTGLSKHDEQAAAQKSRISELDRKLTEAEQERAASSAREHQAKEELQRAQSTIDGVRTDLQLAAQQSEALQRQLVETEAQLKISEEQRAETESKLKTLVAGYESDIASVRGALSRAQDENENIKREQMRLMDAQRKAEAKLANARSDHETEIYRLRKELKEAAGESSAGLAAELEAIQAQLKQDRSQREELEIQLGSRSEQLETVRVELERTTRRLEQAQESARQAEQQLVEANQASSEEMTVRLNAEQAIQHELREEYNKAAAERDRQQEQTLALTQELEQLRAALQSAESKREEIHALQHDLAGLKQDMQRVEQERDQIQEERHQLQQEADQLRAEAEVTRGLVDMGPGGESDDALRAQVAESRRNVEIAVKLRNEAETRVQMLQQEVERMHAEVRDLRSRGSTGALADEIPRLDGDDDADAAEFLDSVLKYSDDEISSEEDQTRQDFGDAEPVSAFVAGIADSEDTYKKPVWRRILAGLLIFGILAAAAFWWLNNQPGFESPAVVSPDRLGDSPATVVPATDAASVDAAEGESVLGADNGQAVDRSLPHKDEVPLPAGRAEAVKQTDQAEREGAPPGSSEKKVSVSESVAKAPVLKQPAGVFQDRLRAGGQGPEMVGLHADKFNMGSGSVSLNFDERPRHEVSLKGFAIGKHEITFDQYERFTTATGRSRPADSGWGRGARPVINISWMDAVAYTKWLSEQTGHSYRLPTEAEWEFVARAGSLSRYWWGNDMVEGKANCFDCGSSQGARFTAPVGMFEANQFGVYDMAGNVREWVQDCQTPNYNSAPGDGAAVELEGCTVRIVRGGSFASPSDNLRSAARDSSDADARFDNLGFRVVRDY